MLVSIKNTLFSIKGLYILGGVVCLILLICVLKLLLKKKNERTEMKEEALNRTRDENLNVMILNSRSSLQKETYVPYDVDYSNANNKRPKNVDEVDKSAVMVQIVEKTGLSSRKFVLNANKGIRIGTAYGENDISFVSESQVEFCCEIIAGSSSSVVARNVNEGARIVLKRKKHQAILDSKGIKLLSGDIIIMDNVSYAINFV